MQMETPVRRRNGERFDFAGDEEGRRLGARAQCRAAFGWRAPAAGERLRGHPAKEYAALFDTVYISMYKYFNSGSGAILAGPKAQLANLYHTRRMFGAGLPQVWTFAAVALHYLAGFEARFQRRGGRVEQVIAALRRTRISRIERIPNGTNIFRLRVFGVNAPVYQNRLENAGITTVNPTGDWFHLQVNETWTRPPQGSPTASSAH